MLVIKQHKIRVHMCLNYLNFYWEKICMLHQIYF
jgi:hypothetical protein